MGSWVGSAIQAMAQFLFVLCPRMFFMITGNTTGKVVLFEWMETVKIGKG